MRSPTARSRWRCADTTARRSTPSCRRWSGSSPSSRAASRRTSVVQRAIAEVGEETAGILQRAHETAEEIAARSRAQAEGRIQRAEREAELLRQEADAYSEKIVYDTRLLWEERQRLIDDIRQLADDVLNTADDAAERVSMPQMLGEDEPATAVEEDGPPTEEEIPPTTEVEFDVLPGGAGAENGADGAASDEDERPG